MADRLGDDPRRGRSPTAARRSATGSPRATRRSATSPTTSRRSAPPLAELEPEWISGYDLARDADLLIHDCQYTDDEYPDHVGWGHSAIERRADLRRAGRRAQRLLLFHHDPLHADDFLDDLARERASAAGSELGGDPALIELGMEGGELDVAPAPAPTGVPAA